MKPLVQLPKYVSPTAHCEIRCYNNDNRNNSQIVASILLYACIACELEI